MPVSPSDEIFVSDITDLVDLLRARTLSETSTEFSDDERDTKLSSVLGPLSDTLLMPLEALVGVSNLRFSRRNFAGALSGRELAAVGMVVEYVLVGADSFAWWCLETNGEDISTQEADLIREGHRLEPHLLGTVMNLSLVVDVFIEWCKVGLVEVSGHQEHGVLSRVAREWLVKRVVADNIGVVCEFGCDVVPEVNEFVLNLVFIIEEVAKGSYGLLGHVVSIEIARLAVSDKRIIIIVLGKTERIHVCADAHLFINR